MKFLTDSRLLLTAIWLGAALFFVVVAQSAFAVLPQRELAGAVVNRTLAILNLSGTVIFAVLFLLSFVGRGTSRKFIIWSERILLALAAAACAVGQFVFGIWIAMKRAEIGRPIDELAVDDPLRIQFNMLHEYSVWTLLFAICAALLAYFAIANEGRGDTKSKPADPFDLSKEFKI